MFLTCCWSVGARDLWGGSVLVKNEISSDKVAFLTFKLSCDGSQATTGHTLAPTTESTHTHTRLRMHETRRSSPSGKCPSRNPRRNMYRLSRKRPAPLPPAKYNRRGFIGQPIGGGAEKENTRVQHKRTYIRIPSLPKEPQKHLLHNQIVANSRRRICQESRAHKAIFRGSWTRNNRKLPEMYPLLYF